MPLQVLVVERQLHDIARPGHRRGEVALRQRARVVVAGELSDLSGVDRLLDPVDRPPEGGVVDLGRIVAVRTHHERDRVGHLGEKRHLSLQCGVLEQLVDRRHRLAAGQLRVRRDPGHPGLPGQAVLAVGVEARVRERVLQVLDVRNRALVERLRPALVDQEPGEARVVGEDDDVAVDRLALRQRALDLAEVRGVVVDVLEVVDLDARLLRELLERRPLLRLLVEVDVELPVREPERVGELLAAACGRRRRAAVSPPPPPQAARKPGRVRAAPPSAARSSNCLRVRERFMPQSPSAEGGRGRTSIRGSS